MSTTATTVSTASILINTAGGLGIFLLGMQQLSEGLQAVAGQRLRKMIAAVTSNRFAGIATGTVVTGIVQSSSVVTVMVVGLVTAGIMTLQQAINVIIGANIGTTVTAWIVALLPTQLGSQSMIIIAVSSVFYLFAKREKVRYTGLAFLGLGMIFFGLELMSKGLTPLRADPDFIVWFRMFHADSVMGVLKCTLVGTIVTGIIQSSSAATAIGISLAYNGVISFETASALVFGMNIGTTVTAWLAALNATTEAKRAALAHTLFNCIGVIILAPFFLPVIVPLFHHLYPLMTTAGAAADGSMVYPHVAAPIAMVHTGFNVINTCLFVPFLGYFAILVRRLVPGGRLVETPRLTLLDPQKTAPVIAVEQARREVEYMADCCKEMMAEFRQVLAGVKREDLEQHIFETEDKLDRLQHDVSTFLGKVMTSQLSSDVAYRARMLLRVADEYESVSDEVVSLLKLVKRMQKHEMVLSDKGREEMFALHDRCTAFADTITESFRSGKEQAPDVLGHMKFDSHAITEQIKTIRASQLQRLADRVPGVDPMKIVVLLDMLNVYRRLKENCLNIGEAMLDEGEISED